MSTHGHARGSWATPWGRGATGETPNPHRTPDIRAKDPTSSEYNQPGSECISGQFYVPLDTQSVTSETGLSRQSLALVLTTRNKQEQVHQKHQKNKTNEQTCFEKNTQTSSSECNSVKGWQTRFLT